MIRNQNKGQGFTLVELAVVVVIVSVLAAFAVPKFLTSVERSKAAEAFQYLGHIRTQQDLYFVDHGTYADSVTKLDPPTSPLEYFETVGIAKADAEALQDGWSMTLIRKGASTGFDGYTVTFTQDGFDAGHSTITENPKINPLDRDDDA